MLKLQRAQNACIRFICNVSKYEHISPFYKSVNILKLDVSQKFLIASLVWKILNVGCPKYLAAQFNYVGKGISTRYHHLLLKFDPPRTTAFNNSFIVMASKLWNSLHLFNLHSPNTVKSFIIRKLMSLEL